MAQIILKSKCLNKNNFIAFGIIYTLNYSQK